MSHVAHKWAPERFRFAGAINISCLKAFFRRVLLFVHHPSLLTLNLANFQVNQQRQEQDKYERNGQAFTAEFPLAQRGESRFIAFACNVSPPSIQTSAC